MSTFYVTRHGVVMAALATLGAVGAVLQPAAPVNAARAPMACDIRVSHAGGLVALKPGVSVEAATSGRDRLRVVSSGGNSSNIDQSGEFSVANGSTVVSSVSLGGSGNYTARLTVTADGRTTECSQKVGGSL